MMSVVSFSLWHSVGAQIISDLGVFWVLDFQIGDAHSVLELCL